LVGGKDGRAQAHALSMTMLKSEFTICSGGISNWKIINFNCDYLAFSCLSKRVNNFVVAKLFAKEKNLIVGSKELTKNLR
jgi:hypothetical protein